MPDNLPDDLFVHMTEQLAKARADRPDVPEGQLLLPLFDDTKVASSISEHNASGEEMLFVCVRTADAHDSCVVPGSRYKRCAACDALVWMSPATEWTMSQMTNTKILCMHCIPKPPPGEKADHEQSD